VQKFDVPLAEATTSSLEALKAYSLGRKSLSTRKARPQPCLTINVPSSLIRILPWAIGSGLRLLHSRRGRAGREYFTKAFQLREHASEREKLEIAANYYSM
jgi:eukaryotic-like serine/threonine-protein kinase